MVKEQPATLRSVDGLTHEEWRIVRLARVNVLLVGSTRATEKVVSALRPDFSEPIDVWRPASVLVLPPVDSTGTLILRDVGALPLDDQRRLCEWLSAGAGRTRVISTTRQPLFPLVGQRTFGETLYYRLNTFCFRVIEPDN